MIAGYEEDVGNRTSVYVHTAHSITSVLHYLKKYGYTSVPKDQVTQLRPQPGDAFLHVPTLAVFDRA